MNFTEEQLKALSDYFDGEEILPVVIMEIHAAIREHFAMPIAPVDMPAPVVDAPIVDAPIIDEPIN